MSHHRLGIFALWLLLIGSTPLFAQTAPWLHNPPAIHAPHGYSHVAEVPPGSRLIFVAGQVALDKSGTLVGAGDFKAQAQQVFENLQSALEDAGATFADVVKLNFYVVDVEEIGTLREIRDQFVNMASPPASTLVEVRRLFRDDVLIEVEAVAAVRDR